MKQYKLVGWNMTNLTKYRHAEWPTEYPVNFPIVVKATGNLDSVGLSIVLVDVGERQYEFSLWWFVWERVG